jgi:parallel beta-helix repeat protein
MKTLIVNLGLAAAAMFASASANATVYYLSDCQSGAASGCVAGNDSNNGTSAATPWRSISKLQSAFNAGKPGDQFLLAQGGAWTGATTTLFNSNGGNPSALYTNPLVIDSYTPSWGGSAKPILNSGSAGIVFNFSNSGAPPLVNGGYTLRNLSLQGAGTGDIGIRLFNGVQNVVTENLTINGFNVGLACGGLPAAGSDPSYITIRNSTYTNNRAFGIGMWGCPNTLIEGNTLDNNGFTRPMLDHPMYISGSDKGRITNGVVIRNNKLTNNAVTAGQCQATILVGHDVAADWVIENNYIYQAPGTSYPGCWGIAMSPANGGYMEGMDRLVVRGNTVVNVGNNGIELAACRTCTVENNAVIWENTTEAIGIRFHQAPTSPTYTGTALTVRNNSVYFARSNDASRGVVVNDQGTNHIIASNITYFGSGSAAGAACMESNLSTGAFSGWNNNLCYGGSWTSQYATRAAFTSATGFDANGVSADPKFAAAPSLANNFSLALASGSPAINAGSTLLSSTLDRLSLTRSAPDIGAFEFAATGTTNAPPAPPTNVVVQ